MIPSVYGTRLFVIIFTPGSSPEIAVYHENNYSFRSECTTLFVLLAFWHHQCVFYASSWILSFVIGPCVLDRLPGFVTLPHSRMPGGLCPPHTLLWFHPPSPTPNHVYWVRIPVFCAAFTVVFWRPVFNRYIRDPPAGRLSPNHIARQISLGDVDAGSETGRRAPVCRAWVL